MDTSEDCSMVPEVVTCSIMDFYAKHQDSDTDSDTGSSPAFLYTDEAFDASIDLHLPYGDPQDWRHNTYLGIQKFLIRIL